MLNREDFPNLRHDLPRSAEVIITSAAEQWTGADLPLLESVATDMQQMPWAKDNAAAVAATVREVRANEQVWDAVAVNVAGIRDAPSRIIVFTDPVHDEAADPQSDLREVSSR